MRLMRILRTALLAVPFMALAVNFGTAVHFQSNAAMADAPQGSVVGTVIDQRNALPVPDAVVGLLQGGKVVVTAKTDAFGRFSIPAVGAGIYDVSISARGYAPSSTLNLIVTGGATVTVNAALIQAANTSNVHTLGTVTVTGNALASATAITQSVSVQNVEQTGQIRFANQLATLPAINLGTSSSPGDDVSIDIRGFGSSETATLLDGRPVGPLGVGSPDTFNFADTPVAALDSVDVTYGSGSQGLYGSDTIAGAVNMHLLEPTTTSQYTFQQQIGTDGVLGSALDFSGKEGRVGYVGALGVSGLDGTLNGDIFQSARPELLATGSVNPPFACSNANGNDVSKCNQAADTYPVGQNTKLTSELAKFRYDLASNTSLTVSAFSGVQVSNSTGNGDNDFLPYATRLAQIKQSVAANGFNCVVGGGGGTDDGLTVMTNPITMQTACYTEQQFAAASYGPDGGGNGRNRSASMRDYDARLNSTEGKNHIAIDAYANNYDYEKDSSLSGGLSPNGFKLGTPDFTDFFDMHGYLASDDILGTNNDFGFGYALLNQDQFGNQLVQLPSGPFAFAPDFPTSLFREGSFFIRDNHEFGDRFSGFLNAWVKKINGTGKSTFDPRLSGQYRPDSNDVLRLTYGHSDGPPAPELSATGPLFEPSPGNSLTSVTCTPYSNTLGASLGNPNLTDETANDVELGYGHRFADDSNVQVNTYITNVSNEIFSANLPLTAVGINHITFASGALQDYLSHLITQGCLPAGSPLSATYPFLSVPTNYNAADELARGIDLNGRLRISPRAYIDAAWSVESSQQMNIPASILANNPTLLDGGQQNGLPLHQASASIDVQPGAFEVRLDNYYIGNNNPLDRPAYWYSNFFVSHPLNHGQEIVTLGGTNIFNSVVQYYGLIGLGQPLVVNQFAPVVPLNGIAQNIAGISSDEEYGLQPAQLSLTLTVKM
jgi:hypothetical protein